MKKNVSLILIAMLFSYLSTESSYAQKWLNKALNTVEKVASALDPESPQSKEQPTANSSPQNGIQINVPVPNLIIKYVSFTVSGTDAILEFTLTSARKDANINLAVSSNRSIAYDNLGNKLERFSVSQGGDSYANYPKTLLLPADIPVNCKLRISRFDTSASVLKRLDLSAKSAELGLEYTNVITFQNIQITKSENYEAFSDKFIKDAQFQLSRIAFPIKGGNSEGENWTKGNWSVMQTPLSDFKNNKQYKYDIQKGTNSVVEKLWIPDSDMFLECHYELIDGKWYLTAYYDNF